MTRTIVIKNALSAVVATALVCGTATSAQAPVGQPPSAPAKQAAPEKPLIPLKVLVTLSRFEGEKKTGSLPFTLWVNANDLNRTSLNMAMSVPLHGSVSGSVPGDITYRNVGTSLSCTAMALDDGRFRVDLSINDSSVVPTKDGAGLPTFQSITTQSSLLLRDGQTAQFLAATDKVTGEVTKVEVTISVLK